MDKIRMMIVSPVFAGFVRALVAFGCGWLGKHGLDLGSYELAIAAGVVMLLDMWWSKKAKSVKRKKG